MDQLRIDPVLLDATCGWTSLLDTNNREMKNHEEAKRVFALIQSFNSVDTKKYKNLFLNMSIWRFHEMNRGSPKSPFFNRIFHDIPSILGTPMTMETPTCLTLEAAHLEKLLRQVPAKVTRSDLIGRCCCACLLLGIKKICWSRAGVVQWKFPRFGGNQLNADLFWILIFF